MTIRPICITGEPVLHSRAREVEVFDDELRQLVADMYETMDKAPGVGLAAPQIGVGLRIFTYDYADDEGNERRGVIINPKLEVGPIVDEPADEDTEMAGLRESSNTNLITLMACSTLIDWQSRGKKFQATSLPITVGANPD